MSGQLGGEMTISLKHHFYLHAKLCIIQGTIIIMLFSIPIADSAHGHFYIQQFPRKQTRKFSFPKPLTQSLYLFFSVRDQFNVIYALNLHQ